MDQKRKKKLKTSGIGLSFAKFAKLLLKEGANNAFSLFVCCNTLDLRKTESRLSVYLCITLGYCTYRINRGSNGAK